MHAVRSFPVFILLVLGSFASVATGTEFTLFQNVWGNVIVATDTSEEGRKLTLPTPQHPVYYRGRSLGNRLGSISGDDEPSLDRVDKLVADILAKQGYLGAAPGAPDPGLFLLLQWGYVTPHSENLLWFLGYNPADDIAAPVSSFSLGPEVLRRNMRSILVETILQDSEDPIYGIIVSAFDSKTVRTPKPVIYWQTRISLPANGKSMAEALPVMVVAAGEAIGRPADKPLLLDADHAREGHAEIGELKFLEFQPETGADSENKARKK